MRISDWSSDVCSSDLNLLSPFERIGQCSTCPKLHRTAPARGDRLVPLNNHLLFFEMFQILVRYASQQIQRLLQPRRRHGRKDQKSVHHEWQGRPLIESRLKRSEERRVGKRGVSPGKDRG